MKTKDKKKRGRAAGPGTPKQSIGKIDRDNPNIWEPSTKDPDKAIDKAFGLWKDEDQPQTPRQAQAYRNKLWQSKRKQS